MSIKNILLHLSRESLEERRIELAFRLATAHDSHVTGLYVMPIPHIPGYLATYVPEEVLQAQREQNLELAEQNRAKIEAMAGQAGVSFEWRLAEGDPRDLTALHAYYSDLVIVGQTDPDEVSRIGYDLAEEVVLTAGTPILTVPYVGKFERVGDVVLVAWNRTREAARAVHDAKPVLVKASKVIVFAVNPPDREQHIAGTDISAHLARHGVRVEAHHTVAKDMEVGDILLSTISDMGADMMVMGAYGHSRLREFALGGATRTLLRHMTVPVLMSH